MASPIKEIVCPNCGKPYIYEANRWKDEVVCGNCNAVITVDESSNMLPPAAAMNAHPAENPATVQPQSPYGAGGPLPPHLMNAGMAVDPQAPLGASASLPESALPPATASSASQVAPATLPTGSASAPNVDRSHTSAALDRLASRPASNLHGIIAGVVILVVLLVAVGFAIRMGAVFMNAAEDGGSGSNGSGQTGSGGKSNGNGIHWAEAPKEASKVQKMQIRVPLVQYGEIRGKDATRQVLTSSGNSYLQIFIELRNRGLETPYVSWYGNEFQVEEETRFAKLVDQDGVTLDMMIFEDVASVQGHTARAKLKENERMEDVLIFELPEGRDLNSIKALYLTLPGQAFDANGTAHFKIPRSIIRTLSDRPDTGLIGSPLDGGDQPEKDE